MREKKTIVTFGQYNLENLFFFALMGVASFVFLMRSPLHPWNRGETGTDSSVFKTIAMMMEKGYMPYRDSFDHKGPLLYLINWAGNRISKYHGVWIIEFVFLTITLFIMYKTARLLCKKKPAVLVTFISQTLMFGYYQSGNLTEEYAMMFIAVSTFIFIEYFINGNIDKNRLILCGLTFACTLLLRPNMIALWVVMCLAVLVKCLAGKKYKQIGMFIFWFIVGMIIVLIPVMIWLGANGALEQCFKDYILFNQEYSSAENGGTFSAKWVAFFVFLNTSICMMALIALLYFCVIRKNILDTVYFIYMILTLIFICISGRSFGHYGMVLVPAVVYPLSLIFVEVENIDKKPGSRIISLLLYIYLLISIILPEWGEMIKNIPVVYETREESHISENISTIVKIINNTAQEKDAISVYGNWDIIYVLSNHRHATRYSYQYPICQVMPEIMDEYLGELQEELPSIVVVQKTHYDSNIGAFLDSNQYHLLWSENGESMDGALIYARTD